MRDNWGGGDMSVVLTTMSAFASKREAWGLLLLTIIFGGLLEARHDQVNGNVC